MRILFTGMVFHPNWRGGEPKIAKSLYNYLSLENNCHIITFHPRINYSIRKRFSRVFSDLDPFYFVYNHLFNEFKPDLVITFTEPSTSVFQSCKKHKIPLILSLHFHWPYSYNVSGLPTEELVAQKKYNVFNETMLLNQFRWRKKRISQSSGIVTASNFMRNEIVEKSGVSEIKVKTIYNGINPKEYRISEKIEKEPLFLMLGPLTRYKGVQHFIKLSKKIANNKIKFAATGNPIPVPGIDMLGYLPKKELIKYIHKACAIILPSIWAEPSSLVPLEAMACGTPIIAYDSGGNSELIKDGITGFIVDKGSIKSLSEKVLYLSQDMNVSYKMGINGKQLINKYYNINRMGIEYYDYIRSILFE